jgi:hypothetical protein
MDVDRDHGEHIVEPANEQNLDRRAAEVPSGLVEK